jgi:hypothetical protein
VEALWFQWALPLCVADALSALRHTFSEVANQFQRSVKSGVELQGNQAPRQNEQLYTSERAVSPRMPSSRVPVQAVNVGVPATFTMPAYQFVSNNIAQKFPGQVASRLVLSYRPAFPHTITTLHWPATLLHWTSGLHYESLGYVTLGYTTMWLGANCPVFIQQMVISGLISAVIWLLSRVVRGAIRGDFLGVYVLAAVVAVLFLCVKSFEVSWNRDAAKFAAGVQSLFPDVDELRIRREQESAPPSPLKRLQRRVSQRFAETSHALQGAFSPSDVQVSPAPLPVSPLNTPRGSGLGPIEVVSRRVAPLRTAGMSKKGGIVQIKLARANAFFGLDVKEDSSLTHPTPGDQKRGVFDLSSSSSEGSTAHASRKAPVPAVARTAMIVPHLTPGSAGTSMVAFRSPTAASAPGRALYADLSDSGGSDAEKQPLQPAPTLLPRSALRKVAPTPAVPALRALVAAKQPSSDSDADTDSTSPAARLRAMYEMSSSSGDSSDSN